METREVPAIFVWQFTGTYWEQLNREQLLAWIEVCAFSLRTGRPFYEAIGYNLFEVDAKYLESNWSSMKFITKDLESLIAWAIEKLTVISGKKEA